MASGPSNGLWSFIKELLFSKQSLADYIMRNKLFSLLVFSNKLLFVLVLFATEQAIQHYGKENTFKTEVARLNGIITTSVSYEKSYNECVGSLNRAEAEHRCTTVQSITREPNPPKRSKRVPEPVLAPRAPSDDLRKKLDDIR